MRENMGLYRGKRTDNGEWIEGSLIKIGWRNKPATYSIMPISPTTSNYIVDSETVGQFTGLTVTNGMVFDGDFLKFGERILEVFWNEEAFQWQAKQIDTDLEIHRSGCGGCHEYDWTITDLGWIAAEEILTGQMTTEIIGNKWDKSEILKNLKFTNHVNTTFAD